MVSAGAVDAADLRRATGRQRPLLYSPLDRRRRAKHGREQRDEDEEQEPQHDDTVPWRVPADYTVLYPPSAPQRRVFAEVAEEVAASLRQLAGGRRVGVSTAEVPGTRHLVLGPRYFTLRKRLPAEAVLWNMEHAWAGAQWLTPTLVAEWGRRDVWDQDSGNLQVLRYHGVEARHLPYGWSPAMRRCHPVGETVDVAFYGARSPRRLAALDACRARGLTVEAAHQLFGVERDALVARARVVLNVHFYDGVPNAEWPRLFFLAANGRCVVSESVGLLGERRLPGVTFAPHDRLAEACAALVADEPRRRALGEEARRSAEASPMAEGLVGALGN